jgi:hypothetical protein
VGPKSGRSGNKLHKTAIQHGKIISRRILKTGVLQFGQTFMLAGFVTFWVFVVVFVEALYAEALFDEFFDVLLVLVTPLLPLNFIKSHTPPINIPIK